MSYDFGLIGLGTMGQNLLLNIADHGFSVFGLDKDPKKAEALRQAGEGKKVGATTDAAVFLKELSRPRALLLLVPAGKPVDDVVAELKGSLEPGDLIIDGGNSHFTDTERRGKALQAEGILFSGMGISGGEEGARRGPSMMPGGPKEAYVRLRPIWEAVAARAKGEPCVAYLGSGAAGHYVKMVHNGIEYAFMQMIAESYDVLHRGAGLSLKEVRQAFAEWNEGPLASFLLEITTKILAATDDLGSGSLLEAVRDAAGQKGTGTWTTEEALQRGVPIPTIDAAVTFRNLSGLSEVRKAMVRGTSKAVTPALHAQAAELRDHLHQALAMGVRLAFAQGMALLRAGSEAHGYDLDLATVASIWRGGCIIRTALLEDLRQAFQRQPKLSNLLLDEKFSEALFANADALRSVVQKAAGAGIAVPALASALFYFDTLRTERLPTQLIQAQRDFFGAHGYERLDRTGRFHSRWDH